MGELIALLFLARELAHRAHLKVSGPGAYAAHVALGEFYSSIGDHADSIAEAYQGQTGLLLDIPMLEGELTTNQGITASTMNMMVEHLKWLEDNRYTVCPREMTSIHNLIDEAVALYQSTLYKLRFLG